MLKSAHYPSVYWGKFNFLYRESVRIFKKSFDAVFCFRLKNTLCFYFARLKTKRGLLKTYFLPLMLMFISINSELRNFLNDQMTANMLIINALIGH